jgi:putative transposase
MQPKLYLANTAPTQAVASAIESTLDQIAREGARRMLIQALQLEVADYIGTNEGARDEDGRALVVRNGKARPRQVTLGCGTIEVEAPRVRDRRPGQRFTSAILPPYLRKSPKVENLLPILYLKGLSNGDFQSALEGLLGAESTAGLSPSSIVALKRSWEREHDDWRRRPINERFAYIYADGIQVSIRLGEDRKLCLLVLIGVSETGEKRLLAVEGGFRESKDSWLAVLRDLVSRGFTAPRLAIGDGALGFWAALRECGGFEQTRAQRCWVHKIANVLNDLPKRLQPRAKTLLREMMIAPTLSDATAAKRRFADEFHAKYPKAVDRVEKDWPELTAFFSFPARHWQHLRTTNAIESTFATVRLRTNVTKGAGSVKAASSMAFKLLQDASMTWNRIRGFEDLPDVLNGVAYVNGVVVAAPSSTRDRHREEAPAA